MEDIVEHFHKNCGEILRIALSVEERISFVLQKYFCQYNYPESWHLRCLILDELDFEDKIKAFQKICKYCKIEDTELKPLIKSIRYLQELRNRIAHQEAFFDDTHQMAVHKTTNEGFGDPIKINQQTMCRVNNENDAAIKGIMQMYAKITDPKRMKEIKIAGS